jgi:hypothetical protein
MHVHNNSSTPWAIGDTLVLPKDNLVPDTLANDPTFKMLVGRGTLSIRVATPEVAAIIPEIPKAVLVPLDKRPVAEVIALVNEAFTEEALKDIAAQDGRKPVQKAVTARLAVLAEPPKDGDQETTETVS